MISHIENKKINFKEVSKILNSSKRFNQWTNFGPASLALEVEIEKYFPNKKAICCSSGTTALHSLIQMHNYINKKPLRWLVPDFTFASSHIGPLFDAKVTDCYENGMASIESINLTEYDGIVVTDIFGGCNSFEKYKNGKILIIDSAYAFDKCHEDCDHIVSFHQTKPWGMGEGGCVVIDKKNENLFRSLINFGRHDKIEKPQNQHLSNAKMSDFNAALILQRIKSLNKISNDYREQFNRIVCLAKKYQIELLIEPISTPGNVPLIFPGDIHDLSNNYIILNKYYKPNIGLKQSKIIYNKIVNFPCHPGVKKLSDKNINNCFEELLK